MQIYWRIWSLSVKGTSTFLRDLFLSHPLFVNEVLPDSAHWCVFGPLKNGYEPLKSFKHVPKIAELLGSWSHVTQQGPLQHPVLFPFALHSEATAVQSSVRKSCVLSMEKRCSLQFVHWQLNDEDRYRINHHHIITMTDDSWFMSL